MFSAILVTWQHHRKKTQKFYNRGNHWIKIADLNLEQLHLSNNCSHTTLLTPDTRDLDPSILAFSDSTATTGVIVASEIPSKLRRLSIDGINGYNPDLFEWVLGPRESFESEPVFLYAFSGKSYRTISAVSTALDRCNEDGFRSFLKEKILLPVKSAHGIAPLFCSWTNYISD